ncbi:hypothetical protein INR49_019589 [Caranx melampygus]|nr:hypothetical protein INR49_019589 [Caranx melampygus]
MHRVSRLCPSASQPHPSSAPHDKSEQHSFPYTHGGVFLRGGLGLLASLHSQQSSNQLPPDYRFNRLDISKHLC